MTFVGVGWAIRKSLNATRDREPMDVSTEQLITSILNNQWNYLYKIYIWKMIIFFCSVLFYVWFLEKQKVLRNRIKYNLKSNTFIPTALRDEVVVATQENSNIEIAR